MVLATVFVINKELANGVVTGKYFWFYICMGLSVVSVMLSFWLNRKQVQFSLIDFLIILFGIMAFIISYYHHGEVTNKLIVLILTVVLFFCLKVFIIQYKWNTFILITFFIMTGMIEAIWGLMQLYGFSSSQHSFFKITGSFFNPGPYAGYLAMIFSVAFYFLLSDYRVLKKHQYLYLKPFFIRWSISLITLISILLILPATMSRASWIAAICGCSAVGLFYLFRKRATGVKRYLNKYQKKIPLVVLPTMIFIIISFFSIYNLKKDSADGRVLIWKTSMQVILEHPLGVGLANFSGAYGDAQSDYFASGEGTTQEKLVAGSPKYAFNDYFQLCIELGIIPFLVFVSVIASAIYIGVKRKKNAPLAGLIALLVFSAMSYPLNLLPFVIAFVFLLALCLSKGSKKEVSIKGLIGINLSFLIILFVVASCLYHRYPTYDAYKRWNKVKSLNRGYLHEEGIYKKLHLYLGHEIPFLFEYAQSLFDADKFEESNAVLVKAIKISCDPMLYNLMGRNNQALKNYCEAENNYIKAANIVPSRLYPYYLLAKLYKQMGRPEKICQIAEIMETKEVKVYSPAIYEMISEIRDICSQSGHYEET